MSIAFITAASENDLVRLQQLKDCEVSSISKEDAVRAIKYAIQYDALHSVGWILSNYKGLMTGTFLFAMCERACIDKASRSVLECLLDALLDIRNWSTVKRYLDEHWDAEDAATVYSICDQRQQAKLMLLIGLSERSGLPDDVIRLIVRSVK